jgi:hypothetical protein
MDAIRKLAYFFEFDYCDGRKPGDYARPLVESVEEWLALAGTNPPRLDAYGTGDLLVIEDTRPCAVRSRHIVTGLAARVYRECDVATKPAALARRMNVDVAEIEIVSGRFLDEKLMLEMDGQVLSLAIFRDRQPAPIRQEENALTVLGSVA